MTVLGWIRSADRGLGPAAGPGWLLTLNNLDIKVLFMQFGACMTLRPFYLW